MVEWIERDLTSLAFLWRLERRDGVALGFTSHDRDLVREGLIYRAVPGMLPSAIERSDGFDVDSVELAGALTSDALTEADLRNGRWDGAALRLLAVDWTNPGGEAIPLVRGELGTVETGDGSFTAELRGPAAILDAPVAEETSPDCRASLGDRRCGVDMAGRRKTVQVIAAEGAALTLDQAEPDGIYGFGRIRFLEGEAAGLTAVIASSAGTGLVLREPLGIALAANTRAEISQGCDRRFATCTGRFGNAANFRGEPHLPGNDLLTRYAS